MCLSNMVLQGSIIPIVDVQSTLGTIKHTFVAEAVALLLTGCRPPAMVLRWESL